MTCTEPAAGLPFVLPMLTLPALAPEPSLTMTRFAMVCPERKLRFAALGSAVPAGKSVEVEVRRVGECRARWEEREPTVRRTAGHRDVQDHRIRPGRNATRSPDQQFSCGLLFEGSGQPRVEPRVEHPCRSDGREAIGRVRRGTTARVPPGDIED